MNKEQASFTEMVNGTADDYKIIGEWGKDHTLSLSKRLIDHMKLLEGDTGGFAVDRLTHCLQTATRAHKDGRDVEYVVCALLHDIGDTFAPTIIDIFLATIVEQFFNNKTICI